MCVVYALAKTPRHRRILSILLCAAHPHCLNTHSLLIQWERSTAEESCRTEYIIHEHCGGDVRKIFSFPYTMSFHVDASVYVCLCGCAFFKIFQLFSKPPSFCTHFLILWSFARPSEDYNPIFSYYFTYTWLYFVYALSCSCLVSGIRWKEGYVFVLCILGWMGASAILIKFSYFH